METAMDIVCHAFPSWRGNYVKSTVKLMSELALRNRVLYIDYAYSWKDILFRSWRKGAIPWRRILGLRKPWERVALPNGALLYVLSLPPVIPSNWIRSGKWYDRIQKINALFVARRINAAMHALDIRRPVTVNAFNPFYPTASLLPHSRTFLYYCYDHIAAAPWAGKHGARLEKRMMNSADAVVFSSNALQLSNKMYCKASYVVKNGVDTQLFMNPQHSRSITSVEKKICYIGSMDDRLNYVLLLKLIDALPNYAFHFIGRITSAQAMQLSRYSNVQLHDAVPPEKLPGLVNDAAAGIIPFVSNSFTSGIYPMKVNEYLAMGLPVIMTQFARLEDLDGYVAVASEERFAEVLLQEIAGDTEEKRQSRRAKAESNDWKWKAREFELILRRYAQA